MTDSHPFIDFHKTSVSNFIRSYSTDSGFLSSPLPPTSGDLTYCNERFELAVISSGEFGKVLQCDEKPSWVSWRIGVLTYIIYLVSISCPTLGGQRENVMLVSVSMELPNDSLNVCNFRSSVLHDDTSVDGVDIRDFFNRIFSNPL